MTSAQTHHPKGLYFLFFTEMWEKFSFFGMRAILVYYMTKHLMFSQEYSSHIYGLYTGLIYLTPVFGGILADRFLGKHTCVIIGAVLMAIGYFLIGIKSLFFLALLLLIIGHGAFAPNTSAQVGALYQIGDPRRDRAFSIFYLGINIGAFFSPLICGALGEIYGWHYGFGAAGVGMVISLIIYLAGQKYLPFDKITKGLTKCLTKEKTQNIKSKFFWFTVLILFSILFRAVYGQQGNTLALWLDTNTERYIFGWEMPASWFQSFNPLMVIFFTPIVTSLWCWQAKHKYEPSSIAKIVIGFMITGVAFLVMMPAAHSVSLHGKAHLLWPTICIFLITIGELYVFPVALSLVTKIAPPTMVSIMMGMWFLSHFVGNYLSGFLGTFWEKIPKESFFLMLSLIALSAGFGMLIVMKSLKQKIEYS